MKLVEAFLTRNPCYRAGKKIKVKGIVLHSVGCPQPRASVFMFARHGRALTGGSPECT